MKPTFLVIGAAKCGTTTLCHLLGQHPEVFIASPREPHFFSRDERYDRGWGWYESLFAGAHEPAVGEGSTTYGNPLKYPAMVSRIAHHLPECRFIYMVRDPLQRIESEWKMARREGWALPTFSDSVRSLGVLEVSSYWRQLSRYLDVFPASRFLVVFLKDLATDPEAELARCFRHLGVPVLVPPDAHARRNVAGERRRDGLAGRLLRRVPGSRRLHAAAPEWMRSGVRRALTRPVDTVPAWDEGTLDWTRERLAEDARRFLRWAGKPDDFWSLEPEAPSDHPATTESRAEETCTSVPKC